MKKLGVIGGLGPMATAYFFELIVKMTDAKADGEHVPMIIYNYPEVPDRTDYILGKIKDNPADDMIAIGNSLACLGVDNIAIPCITAHYFYNQLLEGIGVPIINMIKETADYLEKNNIKKVGIMATDGTIERGFFAKELESKGISAMVPSKALQNMIMSIIYDSIKANKPYNIEDFRSVEKELRLAGAQVIILGCTELSIIKKDGMVGKGFLDVMDVLAVKSIERSGALLKQEYKNLIT